MQDARTAGREAGVRAIARHHVPAERLARMAREGAMAYVLRHAHRLTPAHALDIFAAYQDAYLNAAAGAAAEPDAGMGGLPRLPGADSDGHAGQAPAGASREPDARVERLAAREHGAHTRPEGTVRRGPHRGRGKTAGSLR
jgi:hypothetical protein